MNTFIMKFQSLLIIQILGTKCLEIHIVENTTIFVDNGDTVDLNCTCFRENVSSWNGPGGSKAMRNDTVLVAYSDGLQINPKLNITNIDIYGNFTIGQCHLRINNFSNANDGNYQCTHILNDIAYARYYNIYSKRPPTNLKIVQAEENNIIYGREGVQLNLTCTVKNGLPAATLLWRKDDLTVANGSSDTLLYKLTPTRFDHLQNITCYINSDLLISPLSQTIQLDIQYRPYLIIQRNTGSIVEGESMELCCVPNSNPHIHYIAWERNKTEVTLWRQHAANNFDKLNDDFCFRIHSVYRNHTGNYMCFAENSISKSNSSIAINVLYPPDVIVTYIDSEQSIMLNCNPDGNPDNYTFYNWEHRSDFNEHIRWFHGTPDSQLIINKSQNRKANEDDGIYVCSVSNGVSNQKGNVSQEGQVRVESSASPAFFADNEPVQIGQYGTIVELTIKIYDKLYNSKVFITRNGTTVKTKARIENITTYDTSYGVRIRVSGIQYTIQMHLASGNDFTNYTVEACNDIGCNHYYVQVQSANCPESPSNISVKVTGQRVTVSWYPGFDGGFDQTFLLELRTDFSLNFTVIVPKNETTEENMDYILDNLSPNTAYFIRIFSRNKIGDSNKTDYVAFITPQVLQEESIFDRKLIALPVITTIGLCLTIVFGSVLYMKQKAKRSFETHFSGTEDEYASDTQGSPVENRLYQSAEFLDSETRRRDAELLNPTASSSHNNELYEMQKQTHRQNDGRSLQNSLVQRFEDLAVEPLSKITEADLNYAEIVFEDRQLPGTVVIHGIENKTIYSDIVVGAQLINLLSTTESSSESENDFIYVDGIENYTERRKMNVSQQ